MLLLFLICSMQQLAASHHGRENKAFLIKTQTNAIWQNILVSHLLRVLLTSEEKMALAFKKKKERSKAA